MAIRSLPSRCLLEQPSVLPSPLGVTPAPWCLSLGALSNFSCPKWAWKGALKWLVQLRRQPLEPQEALQLAQQQEALGAKEQRSD